MKYSNFRDPFGLVLRMLRSGDAAARSALFRVAAAAAATPLDLALQGMEKEKLASAHGSSTPIFLVVGPPRSGTTLVYQVLARALPFSYFNNLSELFPNSPISALSIFKTPFRVRDASLQSFYGNTKGLTGVNDGFHVWNRWLGADRYAPAQEVGQAQRDDMVRFFGAWFDAFRLPLLNKNNRNSLCVGLLASLLPTSIFVVVTRNPVYVAQSLLIARERIQGSRQEGWGLGAHGRDNARFGDPLEDVADQVRVCLSRLHEQLDLVSAERVIRIRYEDFCADPAAHVAVVETAYRRCYEAATDLAWPASSDIAPLRRNDSVQLPSDQFRRLNELLATATDAYP